MPNDYILKLKRLSPALQARLSGEKFLAKLDELDAQYGIKAVLTLINLLLGELDYANLVGKLKTDYGFNDFLAQEVKNKFGDLIKELGEGAIPPPIKSTSNASKMPPMVFSRADEEEVSRYAVSTSAAQIDYSALAKNIISAYAYQSADEVMAKRLENIIIARARDVRDNLETKESLVKSKKVGGMEFSDADADRLLNLIKNKNNISAPAEIRIKTDIKPANNDLQPIFEMEDGLPVVRMPEKNSEPKLLEPEKLLQPPDDVKIKAEASALPAPSPAPYIAEKRIPESVLNAKTASRPNLDDVKLGKRLMGPIEELENTTIIDFRRMAADPQAAVNKIKEKIDLLEKDSFNQKMAGIGAWQKSEVSRFYRMLGQASMSEGKNIEDIIKERLMSGKPTLSLDEFHAVMELNRVLRY